MINNSAELSDLIVSSGGTNSRTVRGVYEYNDAEQLVIYAPAVLLEAGVIQVNDADDGSGNWVTLVHNGADVTPPLAGKAKAYGKELCATMAFRIQLAAVAADRTFKCSKQWST